MFGYFSKNSSLVGKILASYGVYFSTALESFMCMS